MRVMKTLVVLALLGGLGWYRITDAQVKPADSNPPANAAAADEPTKRLEDIFAVISDGRAMTATKTERLVRLSPSALTVITRRQIEEMGAHSLAEVLRLVPGLNFRMTPMGNFYGIRSFGSSPFSTRILLLVDGFPFNSPDKGGLSGHPGFDDFFPLEQIRRIEIVKGPGSVLYGQNAFEGVINIITRDPEESARAEVDFFGGARGRSRISVTTGGKRGNFGYTFTGKFNREEGPLEYQRRDGVKIRGGDAYFRSAYKGFELTYLLHRDTYDSFNFAGERTAEPEQTLHMLTLSYARQLNPAWSYRARMLYNRRDGTTCAACHDPRGNGTLINGAAANVSAEHETNQRAWANFQLNFTPVGSRHNVIFGVEHQLDRVTKNIVQRTDHERAINTTGAFVQDEIALSRNLIATLGVRLDENERTGSAASPTASLVYQPRGNLIFRALFGRAFREPTWNEFFINQRFLPQLIPIGASMVELRRVGNPNLKPEKINTAELGFEYFINRKYSLKADTYYSYVQDYIQSEDFNTLAGLGPFTLPRPAAIGPGPAALLAVAFNRKSPINSAGGEIEFRFRPIPQISGIGGYAYQAVNTNPRTDSQNAYAPAHKFTLILDAEPLRRLHANFNMNTSSSFTSSIPGLTSGQSSVAPEGILFGSRTGRGYALANLALSYQVLTRSEHQLRVMYSIDNIFNQKPQLNPLPAVNTGLRGTEHSVGVNFRF